MTQRTVLVTGASGYIALHIVGQLLEKKYNVIGTIRTEEKAIQFEGEFKKEFPSASLEFAIIPDIEEASAFDAVLKEHPEITDVLHTASPFTFGLNKDLKAAYLDPAVAGTKNILEAVEKYGKNVSNVVVTSSFAAVQNTAKAGDASFIHTEDTWNPETWDYVKEEIGAYIVSKKYAERLAHDFVKEHKPSWKLTVVCPPYVFGPQRFECTMGPKLTQTAEFINSLLSTDPKDTELFGGNSGAVYPSADVRDIALLHILAIEKESLRGQRLMCDQGPFLLQKALDYINEEFPELDGKIAKGCPEKTDAYIKDHYMYTDTSKTLKLSGVDGWIPLRKTVVDSTAQNLAYKNKQ